SKRLPQGDVELGSFHTRYRVQVAPDIEANGPYWRVVPQADTHRIRVIPNEVTDTNGTVDIPAVVENRCSQSLFDSQRKTEFRIEHEQLIAAPGDLPVHARRGDRGIGAGGRRALGTRSIDREATKRGFTAGEEALTRRNVSACKRMSEPQCDPVCPDRLPKWFVIGALAEEASEVGVGAQSLRCNAQVQRLIKTSAGIQRLVARIANPGGRQG